MAGRLGGIGFLSLIALGLLVVAVAVDVFWYRPHLAEVDRLAAERERIETEIRGVRDAQLEAEALVAYFQEKEEPDRDWLEQYRSQDALGVLERLRRAAGVSRNDIILRERDEQGSFIRTRYFMSVEGSYGSLLRFLQAVETSVPLVVVDSFTLEDVPGPASLMLKLNATVYTVAAGGGA